MCGATLPVSLVRAMEEAATPEEARKLGIDFAIRQYEDLWDNGVRYFHFYTLNRADAVTEILTTFPGRNVESLAWRPKP